MNIHFDRDEVLALLPTEILESKEFSRGKIKEVLAALYFYNGMDKVKTDGYFFMDNVQLAQAIGIAENNLLTCLRRLEDIGFISRKSGRRGTSSEYIVFEDAIKNYTRPTKQNRRAIVSNNPNTYASIVSKTKNTYDSIVSNETPIVSNENGMREERILQEISGLRSEMQEIKATLKQVLEANTYASIVSKTAIVSETPIVSTDTDVDKEKEISIIIDTKKKTTTQQTTDTDSLIIIDSDDKSDIQFEDTQTGGSGQRVDKTTNDIFSRKKERIEGMLDRCYTCEQEEGVKSRLEAVRRDIEYLYKLPLSDKQRKWVDSQVKRANGIEKAKTEYFRRGREWKQEYQAKSEAEKAVKAGQQGNIKPQPTAAPVQDNNQMDADNEYTANLLLSEQEQEQEVSREELVKSGRRVSYVQNEMFTAAAALAQTEKTGDELQTAVSEWVYWHTAGMSKVMREYIPDMMLKQVSEYRQRGTAEIDIM